MGHEGNKVTKSGKLGLLRFFPKLRHKFKLKINWGLLSLVVILSLLFSLLLFFLSFKQRLESDRLTLNQSLKRLESDLLLEQVANEALAEELELLQNATSEAKLKSIEYTLDIYNAAVAKAEEYREKGVDISKPQTLITESLTLVTKREFDQANNKLNETNELLDELMTEKLAEDERKRAEAARQTVVATNLPGSGYARITANTSRGSFLVDLLKIDLNGTTVITDSANENDCTDSCPVKPLAQYVADNGGFAGINGTYFCPSDYASCAGKVNSFDFAIFNTRHNRWINATTLFWNSRAMLAFDGASNPYFFREANSFGVGDLKAAIVNYPALVENGANILGNGDSLNDYLKVTKSTRSGIGVKGKMVYLVVARGASVPDLAEIFVSLGVDHAMNLDGGGSSALYYNGRYFTGPGRNLPNAVIFKR